MSADGEMLFDVPEQLSPRLAWMKRHHVKTQFFKQNKIGDKDEFGNDNWPWYAFDETSEENLFGRELCGGATEDDAIAEFARRNKLKMWNEEKFVL